MEEQEDEIKQLNEMILSAKCHAIREAQLTEKKVIKQELKAEESQFKAKQFQFMVDDRNAAIDIIELPMLKIDLSDVRSIFVGYVVIFAIIGVSILQCCQPTMQSPLFVIAAYVISMTAVLIYLISQAKSTSQILLPTFVVAEIAMIAFAIFISFRFENENRPLLHYGGYKM